MKRLMLGLLIALGMGVALAQAGWTHSLHSPFPEPFDFLMLPWEGPAETLDVSECWPDMDVPFLGAGVSFWCFGLAGVTVVEMSNALQRAMADADRGIFAQRGTDTRHFRFVPIVDRDSIEAFWVFRRDEEARSVVAFALRPPEPLSSPPTEPNPEPAPGF